MKRVRVLLVALRLALGDRPAQLLRLARLELALEDAAAALEPFADACPGEDRFGYAWSARHGHEVSGLESGICLADFREALEIHEDLFALMRGAS